MIEPLQADDQLLADIKAAPSLPDRFHLWWLGQSGFLIQWNGHHWLLDPYLSDSLTRKYADTDKPHIRITRQVIAPQRLDMVELVTSSHNHTDHLDADTLGPLRAANKNLRIVVPAANRSFAADRLRVEPDELHTLDAGQSLSIGSLTLHAVPAAHESVERDEQGRCKFLGYVLQFGPFTIYHSGDTVLYDGMIEQLAPFDIDLALLPINGRAPERRVSGNLFGDEAASLARQIGAQRVVPCHYDMFTFNTASPQEFRAACDQLGQPYAVLACGQRLTYPTDASDKPSGD